MATKITEIKVMNCDSCGIEIKQRENELKFIHGTVGQGTDIHRIRAHVNVHLSIPYGTVDADLCKSCMTSILKSALNKLDSQC